MNDKRFKWFLVPCSNCRLRGHACLMLCLTFLNRRHYDESLCPKNAYFSLIALFSSCLLMPVPSEPETFVQRLPNVFQTSVCTTTTQRLQNVHLYKDYPTFSKRPTSMTFGKHRVVVVQTSLVHWVVYFFPFLFFMLFQA